MKKRKFIISTSALLMAFMMAFSSMPVSYASEVVEPTDAIVENEAAVAEDVVDEVIDEEIATEDKVDEVIEEIATEEVSDNGAEVLTEEESEKKYTVTVESEETNGTVTVDHTEAKEGEEVVINAVANTGYTLTQVAYRTVSDDGTKGKTIEVSAVDGKYTFEMPASAVEVGAAFQPSNGALLYNSGTSGDKLGVIGSKENNYSLYIANWEAFISADAAESSVYLSFDDRFLDIEGVTMRIQSRQYNDGGYKVVGEKEYTYAELMELVKTSSTKTESGYIINSVSVPVSDGKAFEAGMSVYCVVQFSCPYWVDAFGNTLYRWNYTGVDATVLEKDAKVPTPIVWLYNLDANSYRGSVVRSVLEKLGVTAGTVNNENLGQNIGYLVGWEGYEPVENPYNSGEYDVEYMLMGNLSDAQMDLLLEAMDDNNIYVALKSIPTAWTASKTFVELFEIMAEESEVLQEAVALDKMIYKAEALDEETYGDSEYWDALQQEIKKALVALQTDAEETGEGADLYRNARLSLEEIYLLVTGKTVLEGDLELLLEEMEDGKYKVTAKLNGKLGNPTFTYNWEPATSSEAAAADHLIVAEEDLYKVSLDIAATGDFYGTMSATLLVPVKPQFEATSTADSITVIFDDEEAVLNTPETKGYVVELYLDGELVQSTKTSTNKVVFSNLNEETEYVLKVNSYNVVGRSDIVELSVETSEEGEVVLPDNENPDEDVVGDSDKNEDDSVDEDVMAGAESEDESKLDETNESESSVKTGDSTNLLLWVTLFVAAFLSIFAMILVRKKNSINA